MFGRTLRASIATDNGRSAEFARKRTYDNKHRCFECGSEGHLSYKCPVNVLGEREPSERRKAISGRRNKTKGVGESARELDASVDNDGDDGNLFSNDGGSGFAAANKRPRIKQSAYFSDDEEVESE